MVIVYICIIKLDFNLTISRRFTLGIATTALGVKMIRQRRSRINAYLRERGFTPDLKRIKPTSESEASS